MKFKNKILNDNKVINLKYYKDFIKIIFLILYGKR